MSEQYVGEILQPIPAPRITTPEEFPSLNFGIFIDLVGERFGGISCDNYTAYDFDVSKVLTFTCDTIPDQPDKGEVWVGLVDLDELGKVEGYGFVTAFKGVQEGKHSYPMVGYTLNQPTGMHKGLATRRLRLFNDQCVRLFGQTLHSALHGDISPRATSAWQRLIEIGEAEVYVESDGYPRYRFKPTSIN